MLKLADLWEALTGRRPYETEQIFISAVTVDSRNVTSGALFVALRGERQDGHAFIGDALARGARAVIAEARVTEQGLGGSLNLIDVAGLQPNPAPASPDAPVIFIVPSSLVALQNLGAFWRRKFVKLRVIGVTGSVGKSSTKELIYAVLRQRFRTLRSVGNLNNEIGLPLTLLQLDETLERAVLEMGMYDLGEIRRLCELSQPVIGVVTLVAPVHLERLGTIERIAQAKAELPEALPAGGTAILNGDDPRVRAMSNKTRANVVFYGLGEENDLWADEIESEGLSGIGFGLHYRRGHWRVQVPLLGLHSVHTCLAAAAVGMVEEMDWEEIIAGLQQSDAQLRLIAVPGEGETTLLDDTYNASPASTLAALNLLHDLSGRRIAVLGDMLELGTEEEQGHKLVGRRAAEVADVIIAVGSRGRMIGEEAIDVGAPSVLIVANNGEAVSALRRLARPGDTILVKGSRGAHMEEIVAELASRPSEPRH